jgi:hypothetical protein
VGCCVRVCVHVQHSPSSRVTTRLPPNIGQYRGAPAGKSASAATVMMVRDEMGKGMRAATRLVTAWSIAIDCLTHCA